MQFWFHQMEMSQMEECPKIIENVSMNRHEMILLGLVFPPLCQLGAWFVLLK